MLRPLFLVIVTSILALLPHSEKSTTNDETQPMQHYAGAMASEFGIGANGEATLGFSIQVIPGTNGLEPSLSVVYNSKGGNGMLGMGMNLEGLSAIHRTGATPVQDGVWGSVTYTSTDRFSLDGQRLMLVEGSYGANGSEYHTEIESWDKVEAVGQCGNGPCSFKVWSADGSLYEYGTTSDSRIEAEGRSDVRTWALHKVTDLHGNYLTVDYTEANGVSYPQRISYTGNDAEGLVPGRFVEFSYEEREDFFPQYEGGAGYELNQRLTKITTKLGEQAVLQYNIEYEYESITGRSQVTKVWQCDAVGRCLPATQLDWTEGNPALLTAPETLQAEIPSSGIYSLDLNADGRTDLVSVQTSNSKVFEIQTWLSDGSELVKSGDFTMPNIERSGSVFPADVNGDGRIDLLYIVTSGSSPMKAYFFESDGHTLAVTDTFVAPANYPTTNGKPTVLDVNGDSRSDIVCTQTPNYAQQQLTMSLFLSSGQSFDASGTQVMPLTSAEESGRLYALDMNTDNLTDLAWVTAGGSSSQLLTRVMFSEGQSFATGTLQSFPFFGGSGGTVMPMDVNGDRQQDLVYAGSTFDDTLKLTTFLSNGVDFEAGLQQTGAQAQSTDRANLVPTDVNGDGLQDILIVNTDGGAPYLVSVYTSNGAGFSQPQGLPQTTGTAGGICIPMDLDGDAMYDLLYANLVQGFDDMYFHFNLFRSASEYPSLLKSIDNGVGGIISVNYEPLTNLSVYSLPPLADSAFLPASSQMSTVSGASYGLGSSSTTIAGTDYPIVDVEMPMYAVSGYQKRDQRGDEYDYSFVYSGAKMDRGGRGWLGFESKSQYDLATNTIGVTYYHQAFPLIGSVDHTSTFRRSDSTMLNRVRNTYLIDRPIHQNANIAQPLLTRVAKELYTYGVWDATLLMAYRYDEFGNATLVINTGDSLAPRPVYTINTYDNDLTAWQIGYQLSSKQSADSLGTDKSKLLSWQMTAYDNERNMVRERIYDNQLDAFVETRYLYDGFGNDTATISAAGDTTFTVFDAEYSTFGIRTISPPTPSGVRLVDAFTYNVGFGQANSHTDYNGVTSYYGFDGLGRQSHVWAPDPEGDTTLVLVRSWVLTGDSGYYQQTQTRLEWDDGDFPWVRVYTDGLLRSYQTSSQGAAPGEVRVSKRWYDSQNRVVKESSPFWEGDENLVCATTVYDPYGRITRSTMPKDNGDSIVTTYSFPTRQQVVINEAVGTSDAASVQIFQEYYASTPQMTVRVNELGDSSFFAYTLLGSPRSTTDAMGNESTLTYNSMGRKLSGDSPGLGHTEYFYFDSLLLNLQTNANGDTLLSRFDALGRLKMQQYSPTDSVVYRYDEASCAYGLGKLTSVILPNGGSYRTTYTAYGNPDSVIFTLDGMTFVTLHHYDANQRLDRTVWPDGSVIRYTYQTDGHMDTILVDDAGDGISGNFEMFANYQHFNAYGMATQIAYGNGVVGTYDYFTSGLMDTLQLTGPENTNLLEQTFSRNYRNNLTAVQNLDAASAAWSQSFTYDAVGSLKTAQGGYGSLSYAYDPAGNMILKDGVNWNYKGFQVESGTTGPDTIAEMHYDGMGNLHQKQNGDTLLTFSYDPLQRLVGMQRNGRNAYHMEYDHQGRRIKRVDSIAGSTVYYVSPTYEVTIDHGSGDTTHTKYVTGDAGLIATITSSGSAVHLMPEHSESAFNGWIFPWPGSFPDWWMVAMAFCVLASLWFLVSLVKVHWRERNWRPAGLLNHALASIVFIAMVVVSVSLPQAVQAQAVPASEGTPQVGVLYFHQDYVSSVQLTTNANGEVASRVHYKPYGEVAELSGEDDFRPKFGGKELDQQSDLYYFSARYYDPQTGRFITADNELGASINQSFAFNQYAYTLNNPVNYTDPSGHNVWSWLKHHSSQLVAITLSTLEIVAGVVLTVVSDGALAVLGEALISSGIEGIVYSGTHFNNFKWSQFGITEGIGFATGGVMSGLGKGVSAGVDRLMSRGATEAMEGGSEATETTPLLSGADASESGVKTGCFVAGTLVVAEDGLKPIEAIEVGEMVWSYNEETQQEELNEVVQLFRPKTETIITVNVAGETIEATPEHPFWVDGQWINAGNLRSGMELRLLDGRHLSITEVARKNRQVGVFNFEVANAHTYYVSESKVLVHNDCRRRGQGVNKRLTKWFPPKSRRVLNRQKRPVRNRIATKRFDEEDFSEGKPHLVNIPGSNRRGLHFPRGSYRVRVEIEYKGSRSADYTEAQKLSGYKARADETWHHYHDYKPSTNRGHMYLVSRSDHARGHSGGVWQYERAHKVKYGFEDFYNLNYTDEAIYFHDATQSVVMSWTSTSTSVYTEMNWQRDESLYFIYH